MIKETTDLVELSQGSRYSVTYDFVPSNPGLLKMINVSFCKKKDKIRRYLAKTRAELKSEKLQTEETCRSIAIKNLNKVSIPVAILNMVAVDPENTSFQ